MQTTKTNTCNVVHFSIHGNFLTNLAREKWIEDNPKNAVDFLVESLPGMPQSLAIQILIGKNKLEGINDLYVEDDDVTELYGISTSIQARWDRLVPRFLDILAQMNSIKSRMLFLVNTMSSTGAYYRSGFGYDNGFTSFSLKHDKEDYIQLSQKLKPIQDDIAFIAELLGKKMSDIPYDQMPDYPSCIDTSRDYPEQTHTFESLLNGEHDEDFENEYYDLRRDQKRDENMRLYIDAARNIAQKLNEPIKPNPITDLNSAGWLAPNGDWYGLNGEIANMLHNNLAQALLEAGIIQDNVVDGNPDGWMMEHGWVKIHGRQILFEGYMREQYGFGRNIPLTAEQKEKLETYGQHMGGWLQFGFKNTMITAARIGLCSDEYFEKAFAF